MQLKGIGNLARLTRCKNRVAIRVFQSQRGVLLRQCGHACPKISCFTVEAFLVIHDRVGGMHELVEEHAADERIWQSYLRIEGYADLLVVQYCFLSACCIPSIYPVNRAKSDGRWESEIRLDGKGPRINLDRTRYRNPTVGGNPTTWMLGWT